MRKLDIIKLIAEETGVPKVDVLLSLETYFKEVKRSVLEGERVAIRGFGSFFLKKRKTKWARNLKTGEHMDVPAHYIPYFSPANEFKDGAREINITED